MLKQPSTNVKQTNVAYIRYRINNKMFEIVCYRNKAVNWRNGLEEDLSEVQLHSSRYSKSRRSTRMHLTAPSPRRPISTSSSPTRPRPIS